MIVIHKQQFIFIHCRQVAGGAIKTPMRPLVPEDRDDQQNDMVCQAKVGAFDAYLLVDGLAHIDACSARFSIEPGDPRVHLRAESRAQRYARSRAST
ncbi:hypothetical protein ACGTN6_19505 [Halomonas sp. THAF12]|uniref:hypothetical protein n=1 Tax=Halomonas sp. B23F22_10 TaxID=3459515 RepID=UPI00373E5526